LAQRYNEPLVNKRNRTPRLFKSNYSPFLFLTFIIDNNMALTPPYFYQLELGFSCSARVKSGCLSDVI